MENQFKIRTGLLPLLSVSMLVLFFSGCTKELKPETTASDLRYYPFGENRYPRLLTDFHQGHFSAIINGYFLIHTGNDMSKTSWELPQSGWPVAVKLCKDKSTLVVNIDPNFYESLNICRVSETGNLLFSSLNTDFFPEYPGYTEHFISCTGDANNGLYMVAALLKNGKWADQIQAKDVYLLHFNAQNTIDLKLSLNNYFGEIVCDENGRLFGLYYHRNTWSHTGTGSVDSVVVTAFNDAALKSKQYKADWTATRTHTEYYTNFYFDRFSLLGVNSGKVFMALPKAKWLDNVYGFDLYAFDKSTGNLTSTLSHTAPTKANTYSEGAFYSIFSNNKGCYVSYRIGASTKLLHMNESGENDLNIDLKGQSNRTEIVSLQQLENSVGVFGYSTFGKSINGKPFVYEIRE